LGGVGFDGFEDGLDFGQELCWDGVGADGVDVVGEVEPGE
jgi:hypothetical protein